MASLGKICLTVKEARLSNIERNYIPFLIKDIYFVWLVVGFFLINLVSLIFLTFS